MKPLINITPIQSEALRQALSLMFQAGLSCVVRDDKGCYLGSADIGLASPLYSRYDYLQADGKYKREYPNLGNKS